MRKPAIVRDHGGKAHSVAPRRRSSVALPKSFHALRLNVLSLLPPGHPSLAPVVSLMSGTPGEGVSTVTAGLASAFAQAEARSVLVIDAAMEGEGLPALGPALPGVSRAGSALVMRRTASGVDVLTLRDIENGTPFLYGDAWDAALRELRADYAYVFVDCGSLHTPVPTFWKPWTTTALLVIDSRATTEFRLHQTKRVLEMRQIAVHGSVLNRRRFPVPNFLYRIFG
ncbi:MAG: hypothetical protein WCZ23_03555 [Rhodospirillaceae bacterium]